MDPAALAGIALGENCCPSLFLACGSEDMLYPANLELHQALSSMGYEHNWWVEEGNHNFDFWNRAIRAALAWWAEGRKKEGSL